MLLFRKFVLSVFSILALAACKYPDKPKTFEYKNKIKVEYAPYLSTSKEIHPNGIFQADNKYRDVYYIVVPQVNKADSTWFSYLYDSLTNDLKKGVAEPYILKDTAFTNEKNYQVRELSMNGKVKEKNFFFIFQLVKKDTSIYQTTGWCFKNKREVWEKDIRAINQSLTILE